MEEESKEKDSMKRELTLQESQRENRCPRRMSRHLVSVELERRSVVKPLQRVLFRRVERPSLCCPDDLEVRR